jgi:hypothetical protein
MPQPKYAATEKSPEKSHLEQLWVRKENRLKVILQWQVGHVSLDTVLPFDQPEASFYV